MLAHGLAGACGVFFEAQRHVQAASAFGVTLSVQELGELFERFGDGEKEA